jgi:anti-anti-sigma regulatory factor
MHETLFVVAEALEGPAVGRWGRLLDDAAARRPERMVVDLRRSPRVDAAAIELLLRVHRRLVSSGGRLTLRAPGARVRRTLTLARVDQVLHMEDPGPAAVR